MNETVNTVQRMDSRPYLLKVGRISYQNVYASHMALPNPPLMMLALLCHKGKELRRLRLHRLLSGVTCIPCTTLVRLVYDVPGTELSDWYLIDTEEIDPALTDPTEGMGALSLDENESVSSSCYS
jgi:hypothetical protein